MNFKEYIIVFALGTAISFVAWVIVLFNIDPSTAGTLAFLAFYLTLFITLNGFFTTSATVLRSIFQPRRKLERIVTISLRQGVIFSVMLTGALLLMSQNLLSWWTLVLLILVSALFEFFFLSLKS
jgi:hypothetical protein